MTHKLLYIIFYYIENQTIFVGLKQQNKKSFPIVISFNRVLIYKPLVPIWLEEFD